MIPFFLNPRNRVLCLFVLCAVVLVFMAYNTPDTFATSVSQSSMAK
jgi:hypothetical protein